LVVFGYDAPQEQFPPDKLLDYAVLAERAGFEAIGTSDHFHPWAHTEAHCGFAWTWLAAAAERTRSAKVGTMVTAPTLRYNPAVVAQAFASLEWVYPGRVFFGAGVGEALNETPVGVKWPGPRERIERLDEALGVMRMLWSREFVSFSGKYYSLSKANLYTKPRAPIPIYVAAGGPRTAELAGRRGDGMVVLPAALQKHGKVLFERFKEGAKAEGKDPTGTMATLLNASYDEDLDVALEGARFWRVTAIPAHFNYDIYDPREIEADSWAVGDDALRRARLVTTSAEEHISAIERLIKDGIELFFIMNVSKHPEKLFKLYEEKVIPYFREGPERGKGRAGAP
jgi:coenzyme F420-dependent glucose-6-phosphate dehydrogenase